jgi:hypothetical protein
MFLKSKSPIWIVAFLLFLLLLAFCSGCKTLLPSGQETSNGIWKSFSQVENTFKKIIPHKTTTADLSKLGIHFSITPNLRTLTYLDVMEIFKLDSTVFNNIKLPPGMKGALEKHEKCRGYELKINHISKKRVGSFWKDILAFEQVTQSAGWSFKALIVMVDEVVVYVLYSGSPILDKIETNKQPLGPFQNIDAGTIMDAASDL